MPLKRRTTEQDLLLAAQAASAPRIMAPPHRRRRRRPFPVRTFLRFAAAAAGVIALIYLSVPLLLRADRLRTAVAKELSSLTGRRVEIGRLRYSLLRGGLVGEDLTIADDPAFRKAPFLRAKSVDFRTPLWILFASGAPPVSAVTFEDATIVFKEDTAAHWNFSSLLEHVSKSLPQVNSPAIAVRGGRIAVENSDGWESMALSDPRFDLPSQALRDGATFRLSGSIGSKGTFTADGKAGPVEFEGGMPILPISALISLKGMDLARLNPPGAPASLGGALSLFSSLESDGRIVHLNGQLSATKLRLAQHGSAAGDKLEGVFALHYDLRTGAGVLDSCDFAMTKGSASLTGIYSMGRQAPVVDLTLSINGAAVTQLAQFLPALGFPLPGHASMEGGVLTADIQLQGPVNAPALSGSIEVNDSMMKQFDISPRMSPVEDLNIGDLGDSIEILSWKGRVKSAPPGIALDNLDVAIAGLGELTGHGTIAPDCRLDFTMSGTRGLTGPKGLAIPFTVQGTCSDPVFRELTRK